LATAKTSKQRKTILRKLIETSKVSTHTKRKQEKNKMNDWFFFGGYLVVPGMEQLSHVDGAYDGSLISSRAKDGRNMAIALESRQDDF
jgi:hypothetical protein